MANYHRPEDCVTPGGKAAANAVKLAPKKTIPTPATAHKRTVAAKANPTHTGSALSQAPPSKVSKPEPNPKSAAIKREAKHIAAATTTLQMDAQEQRQQQLNQGKTAFQYELTLSPALATFLQATTMTRAEVRNAICGFPTKSPRPRHADGDNKNSIRFCHAMLISSLPPPSPRPLKGYGHTAKRESCPTSKGSTN